MSLITFIIPSLNRDTLSTSVESLLNQTNEDWRCIIVYDGVNGISFSDPRIQTIDSKKLGSMANYGGESGLVRNIGIALCNTDWIGFLDDDDTLDRNYVHTLSDKYLDYDFVVWRMIFSDGIIMPPVESDEIIWERVGISFCYNQKKLSKIFFDNSIRGEDYFFLEKMKNLTKNYTVAKEILYKVRH